MQRDGVGPFLERWLDQRLFETLPRDLSQLEIRTRANTVPGSSTSCRDLGQGTQEPLWDRLGSLEMPVLVMTGQWDRTYNDLGTRMAAAIGDNATIAVIPKAGHALHLERPEAVAHELTTWLERSASA